MPDASCVVKRWKLSIQAQLRSIEKQMGELENKRYHLLEKLRWVEEHGSEIKLGWTLPPGDASPDFFTRKP